ncbi:hypothetical protein [Methylobacterium soli]|uniref:Alpha/beta hydrolase n=1 Tax=Methylobacterium soli TaxID=553447 RepID=A0A6L3TA26_9HYPH|nr:hypothetical protein [Methylobacterium soli]KAB1080665.1 hypothetical protein F6X53_05680 [Methylobacterium soli]GJE42806.1 hypothetical protein AEGHOMDF_1979 [Methylobacterium soli]
MGGGHVVIGIHGLANKPPEEEKAKWWLAAIREGIERNCASVPAAFPFDFVYWASLRYAEPLGSDSNLEPYRPAAKAEAFPRYTPEEAGRTSLVGRLYHKLGWLEHVTGLTPLDDVILEYRLDDLWNYHQDSAFRDAARARLLACLRGRRADRILLAAHSMGSIIAYDCLRILERTDPDLRVDHFVTMGAPLGLVEVQAEIAAEHGSVRMPDTALAWTNLTDKADIATVAAVLGDEFSVNARGAKPRDVPVINAYRRPDGTPNHHKSYGYLRTPEFSEIVQAFLAGSGSAPAG